MMPLEVALVYKMVRPQEDAVCLEVVMEGKDGKPVILVLKGRWWWW